MLSRYYHFFVLIFIIIFFFKKPLARRRVTTHLDTPITDRQPLDNDAVSTPRSTSDTHQQATGARATPLRKSASGVATLGRLRVGGTSPSEQEQERPRRRQQNVSRRARDQSLTQFAVIDDENVSQQVRRFYFRT